MLADTEKNQFKLKNRIIVTISFEMIEENKFIVVDKVSNKVNETREKIISAIGNNTFQSLCITFNCCNI